MCDYSLTGIPNRLAVEGEELVTYRFPTGSIGLASPAEVKASVDCPGQGKRRSLWEAAKYWFSSPNIKSVCAVCIAPGTILQMSRIPDDIGRRFALCTIEDVTFTQLTAEPFHYRDAIRFRSGRHVLLQALREGIAFKVKSDGTERQLNNLKEIQTSTKPSNVQCITF
jgi:hypothetical protein